MNFNELLEKLIVLFWCLEMDSMRTPTRTTGHLPGFLLGDTETVGFADSSRISMGGRSVSTSPKDVEMTMAGSTSPQPYAQARPNYGRNTKPAVSGPPMLSLYDVLEDSSLSETKENHPVAKSGVIQQSSLENSEGHWVMVYGFPPSACAHITSHFSQIGTAIEWSFPASGNWMFIKYATRSDARKALSYDGRVINGDIMIGVREGKNITQMRTAYPTTPTLQNSSLHNRTAGSPAGVMSPKIRSLGTPRRSLSVQQTLDTSTTAPTSPSVASKVMDWFAGW